MNPKISILVPVYNVEKYLRRCVDSVLAQDFTDWEMILVDDGSPDRCPQICDEYALKDERIRVVHKENGGAHTARLTGFKEAKGEYLIFLDADDYLLHNCVSILYKEIKKGDYDIVRSCIIRENSTGKQWLESYDFIEGTITNNETYTEYMFHNKIAPYMHSAIFKKEIFKINDFQKVIDGNISIGEDWVTNLLISSKVNKYKTINTPTYIYYYNDNSMMTTTVRSPKYTELLTNVLKEFLSKTPHNIQESFQFKIISNYIINDFRPEITFSKERYNKAQAFLCTKEKKQEIKNYISPKYLVFFHCYFFHRIYSAIYKFLYFNFVLKRHPRKIIP